ncbi:MAG: type 4a pilus biogenesis protein PilO [Pirellulaceae bacterium]
MKNPFGTQGPPGWLVTGGIACIALGYLCFVFLPSQKALKVARQQLAEKQRFILETDNLFAAVSAVHPEFEQTSAVAEKWQHDAPDVHQADRLPTQISFQANLAGIRVLRLEPLAAKPHGLVVEYPTQVSVAGGFEGIFEFLKSVEEMPQTIWLQNVKLHRPGEVRGEMQCDLTLTILGDLAD